MKGERLILMKVKFGFKIRFSGLVNQNISYGVGTEYKYEWGYFDNNGSYEASTKGHSDNLAVYSNLGWNFSKFKYFSCKK